MISITTAVHAIILLIIAGVIFFLLDWLIRYVGIPEPFAKVCRVVLAIVAVLICIAALLTLAGYQVFSP